jgi:hypothetical protein
MRANWEKAGFTKPDRTSRLSDYEEDFIRKRPKIFHPGRDPTLLMERSEASGNRSLGQMYPGLKPRKDGGAGRPKSPEPQ